MMIRNSEPSFYKFKQLLNSLPENYLSTGEYKSLLDEMDLNIKCSENVDIKNDLIIKNDNTFLVTKKENFKQRLFGNAKNSTSNIKKNEDNKDQTLALQDNSNDDKHSLLYNHIDVPGIHGTNKDFSKQMTLNSPISNNCNQNDLQSLLIMLTIDSLTENIQQNETELDDNTNKYEEISDRNKYLLSPIENKKELSSVLNIIQLKKDLNYRQKYIVRKYIRKWKNIIKTKKEDDKNNQRQESINKFFNKLATKKEKSVTTPEPVKKCKLLASDYKTYQHRYKVQKQIIALQKAKLEQQNKMIEELKLNKIIESSSRSLQEIKEGIRDTYYEVDRHLKPKLKCLSKELNIKDLEEPSLILQCLKVPQFLQRMEARARERDEKHAIIRERRKQIEEERLRQKQQEELAKAEMNKEEKIRRMKELKIKRKKEKIENIRKKQYADRLRALIVMADLHYERNLIAKYGIRPFKVLMIMKEEYEVKANSHYSFQLKKNIFLHWMWYTEDMWYERNFKAVEMYRKKLLIKVFEGLKKNYHEYVLKRQVAEDYYDLYVTQLVFRKLREAVIVTKKIFEIKFQKAATYYNSNLLFKTFTCWRTLPALNELQREQEARKLKWRQKVLQVVPDYSPPDD